MRLEKQSLTCKRIPEIPHRRAALKVRRSQKMIDEFSLEPGLDERRKQASLLVLFQCSVALPLANLHAT
jgi:hypothetical protein